MTLFDILQQMEGPDYLPLSVTKFLNDSDRKIIDCRPQSINNIELRFMSEDETWIKVSTYSPILVPWYNCTVSGIDPVDNDTIAVWLDYERFLMDNYSERLFYNEDSDND